jgi:hypothetical protein
VDISKVGYQPVFDQCQPDEQENFENFRYNSKYAFACAVGAERENPDYEALGKAVLYNRHLAIDFLEVGKPAVGYKDTNNFYTPDTLDCRHIMSLTHLFSDVTDRHLNIVEIGGGFGNWARLALSMPGKIDCGRWIIIDIPAMIKLQKWYLAAAGIHDDRLHFATTDEYKRGPVPDGCSNPDVVIGAHSLSEFPVEVFEDYYDKIIVNSRYFYYSTHVELPHPGLVKAKLGKVQKDFTCISSIMSEGGTVLNALYRNASRPSMKTVAE